MKHFRQYLQSENFLRTVCRAVSYQRFGVAFTLAVATLLSAPAYAQEVTATISALTGITFVFTQGQPQVEATPGMVLKMGDTIETQSKATLILEFSDGSQLDIGENTKCDLADLVHTESGARKSRLKMWWGRMRAKLSPGHQEEGSRFEIETPNVLIGVKFSQPDVEVLYDPESKTSIIRAYTVDVDVLNLLTKAEVKGMVKGQQALVNDEFILISRITDVSWLMDGIRRMTRNEAALEEAAAGMTTASVLTPDEQRRAEALQNRTRFLLEGRNGVAQSVSAAPGSAQGSLPTTSENPGTGGQTGRPEEQAGTTDFSFTIVPQ